MNLNASIIDQRLTGLAEEIRERAAAEINISAGERLKSLAFVYLCVQTMLDLDADGVFDCLTEGGGDFGVDALHLSEEVDGTFAVTLFQAKYKNDLSATANFPQAGIEALINAIRHIFDPAAALGAINERLRIKVEQARSMIRDGYIPSVRAIACNNGLAWLPDAQTAIERSGFGEQVTWEHVNHELLVNLLLRSPAATETLRLTGKALVEDMQFSRVCVGRMAVSEVAALMQVHGERLLERNIRRYLGLHNNRVNEDIRNTLRSNEAGNFYFFNNGLTIVCDKFAYNALQSSDFQVRVENLQIVNGGQTCMTILRTAQELATQGQTLPLHATVLVRIYELQSQDHTDLALRITRATNSQTPVELKDLRANDARQQQLQRSIQDLGYTYHRKRMDSSPKPSDITSAVAAAAVLAIWRGAPHQAKFFTREHFGKLYDHIFDPTLNGAQVIIAALLYRIAENRRRRPQPHDPPFVRYASCFIAMQMGRRLLSALGGSLADLHHRSFVQAKQLVEEQGAAYFAAACQDIEAALHTLYRQQEISLQQLSATFRRGDLIQQLKHIKV